MPPSQYDKAKLVVESYFKKLHMECFAKFIEPWVTTTDPKKLDQNVL